MTTMMMTLFDDGSIVSLHSCGKMASQLSISLQFNNEFSFTTIQGGQQWHSQLVRHPNGSSVIMDGWYVLITHFWEGKVSCSRLMARNLLPPKLLKRCGKRFLSTRAVWNVFHQLSLNMIQFFLRLDKEGLIREKWGWTRVNWHMFVCWLSRLWSTTVEELSHNPLVSDVIADRESIQNNY